MNNCVIYWDGWGQGTGTGLRPVRWVMGIKSLKFETFRKGGVSNRLSGLWIWSSGERTGLWMDILESLGSSHIQCNENGQVTDGGIVGGEGERRGDQGKAGSGKHHPLSRRKTRKMWWLRKYVKKVSQNGGNCHQSRQMLPRRWWKLTIRFGKLDVQWLLTPSETG